MRKLRLALIMLLAMLVSVALFACGGKKPDDENPSGDGKTIRSVGLADKKGNEVTSMDFTDVEGETQFEAALSEITITVVYREGGNAKLTADDCTVSGTVEWGTVGNYSVSITPKENNSNKYSASLEVVIDHDFHQKEDDPTMEVCSKDKATRIRKDLNATLSYKGFHVANNYELNDETGSIKPFGTIQTASGPEDVRTTTVGRLEKGMTITVVGTAQNANNLDYAYYFPVLGFADTAYNGPFSAYSGGTAIFVRNEGWVLMNGVGAPRLLAGLVGGSTDSSNYGSHPSDEAAKPDGYVSDTNGYGPSDYNDWVPWHVYSHGTVSRSEDYVSEQNVKFSWSYYDIKEQEGYGLIVLTYYILNANGGITSSLVCTCKVPDSDNGYYDSILHGEFVNMTFSRIETIQTRTLTDITYNGLKSGAKANYVENEYLDFSTLDVTAEYEQNPGVQEPDTQFDVEANVGGAWISLRYTPLSAGMEEFRIVRTVGGTTITKPITDKPFRIYKNAVDVVYGYEFDGYKTNGTIGEIPVATVTDTNGTYVSLVLPATVAASSHGTDSKFVSLRLYARENATQFTVANVPTVKAGETVLTANTDYIVKFASDGSYVDLIIFVHGNTNAGAILTNGVTLGNLVDNGVDVKVELAAINGTASVSEIVAEGTETVYLEKGGKVTVKYHIDEAYWITDSLRYARIDINGEGAYVGRTFLESGYTGTIGGVEVSATANAEDKTITVVYNIPKVTVTNVLSYKLQLDMRNAKNETITQAIDTVYYDFTTHTDSTVGVWDNESQVYLEADGAKLYLVQAFKNTQLKESLIRSSTDSLNLNVNVGTKESVNYLDLGYTYKNGTFVFANSTIESIATGTLTTFGTVGNDYDYDYGAVAVIEVDLSKLPTLGLTEGSAYYFELNGKDEPTYIYKVENGVLSKVTDLNLVNLEAPIAEGNCLTTGYEGKAYKVEGETVFYAAVKPVQGNHSVRDGVCEHCGATITDRKAPMGWYSGHYTINGMIAENSFLEFMGTFSEDETEALGTSSETYYAYSIVLEAKEAGKPVNYVLGGDGFLSKRTGGEFGWDKTTDPVADTSAWEDATLWDNTDKATELKNSLITEKHPNNTINGWVNANGEAIDAETYNEGKIGGTYRYTLTRAKDSNVLVARFRIWKQGVDIITGVPFVEFTYELTLDDYNSINFMGSDSDKAFANSTLTVVAGKMDNLVHNHDYDTTDHCNQCGILNPNHEHTWNHETCTKCLEVCTHENVINNVCQKCHGVWTVESHEVTEVSFNSTTFNKDHYAVPGTVSLGEEITVSGTQTSAMANNWNTVLFRIFNADNNTLGYFCRFDNYGWVENNSGMNSTRSFSVTDADGTDRAADWKYFTEIGKVCNWKVTLTWVSDKHLNATVEMVCTDDKSDYKGWTYTDEYEITLATAKPSAYSMDLTAENTNWTVTEYTHGAWTWNN